MKKIAIIGAGISGLSIARMLESRCKVTVFEASSKAGGLVKCDRIQDNLFHRVGGHVFNSRNQQVLDWFWQYFDRDREFLKAKRNARILIGDKIIGYPIEDYLYEFDSAIVEKVIDELLQSSKNPLSGSYKNFEDFLRGNFGKTLYELYFGPYNRKIWNTDLSQVPLEWLEGKLPMPDLRQIILRNIIRQEESGMVHSTFYYAKENGSQFIIDRLSEGLNIKVNSPVSRLEQTNQEWTINGQSTFDHVIYCGDIRKLGGLIEGKTSSLAEALNEVSALKSNGTSNLFCECDQTDISWMYLPEAQFAAHRIIYTGSFSPDNNRGVSESGRMTCVVEFSGDHSFDEMCREATRLPGNLKPISFNQEKNSYVIQNQDTRSKINSLKTELEKINIHVLGRFAEWEYYNMDKAIEAGMEVADRI